MARKKQPPKKTAGKKSFLEAAQLKWLKETFAGQNNKDIAEHLTQIADGKRQYSEKYVRTKGHELGLKKEKVLYSPEELEFISNNWQQLSWKEIADHLGRNEGAVRKKWHELQGTK